MDPDDGYLRTVPSDADLDDGRLYLHEADPPVPGGTLALRMLMGMGV